MPQCVSLVQHTRVGGCGLQVEGTIPKDLEGTLLRNGPGLFEVGNKKIAQPFDGDGLVRPDGGQETPKKLHTRRYLSAVTCWSCTLLVPCTCVMIYHARKDVPE